MVSSLSNAVVLAWVVTVTYWINIISADDIAQANIATLKFVHVLWRHGDRTPENTMPKDPNHNNWTEPMGELTQIGMRQQYELGQFIRKRYKGYLSDNYSPLEMHVHASAFNRTITSALANMAGMYPPAQADRFLKELEWRPIPVWSQHDRENEYMLWTDCPCPTAEDEYYKGILNSNYILNVTKQNREFLNWLTDVTGMPTDDLYMFHRIHDILNAQRWHNDTNPWPLWMNQTIFDRIFELQCIETAARFSSHLTKRLRGGTLFGNILSRMENKTKDLVSPKELKYYAYSAHDTTIAALLSTLGAYNGIHPSYASALFVELHQRPQTSEYEVQLVYKNDCDSNQVLQLAIPSCGSPCVLGNLRQFAVRDGLIPVDWNLECGKLPAAIDPNVHSSLKTGVGILTVLCIALIGAVIWLVYQSRLQRFPQKI